MKICKMELPKDLEPDLVKFHENAQNPVRYVLMNFEEREVEYKDDKWEFVAIYSSLKDAIFSYLSLWNCQPHNMNEYKDNKWIYHPDEYGVGYKGLYIFEAKEGTIYGRFKPSSIYQIKNRIVYKYENVRRENYICLEECQKVDEFNDYLPLKNFNQTKL